MAVYKRRYNPYSGTLTPQWSRFDANMLYVGGQDENFFEWAQANIDYLSMHSCRTEGS